MHNVREVTNNEHRVLLPCIQQKTKPDICALNALAMRMLMDLISIYESLLKRDEDEDEGERFLKKVLTIIMLKSAISDESSDTSSCKVRIDAKFGGVTTCLNLAM